MYKRRSLSLFILVKRWEGCGSFRGNQYTSPFSLAKVTHVRGMYVGRYVCKRYPCGEQGQMHHHHIGTWCHFHWKIMSCNVMMSGLMLKLLLKLCKTSTFSMRLSTFSLQPLSHMVFVHVISDVASGPLLPLPVVQKLVGYSPVSLE